MLSNLLKPGQVLAGAPTATPTVVWVWALEISPRRIPMADRLCCSRRPLPPQSKPRYSFILLRQERQLCASFLQKEIMPKVALAITVP